MTVQEQLAVIDKVYDYPCPYGIGGTAWRAIRSTIERLTPKEPERSDSEAFYICPNTGCRRFILRREQSHGNIDIPHCKWCGQALEWTKEGENNDR